MKRWRRYGKWRVEKSHTFICFGTQLALVCSSEYYGHSHAKVHFVKKPLNAVIRVIWTSEYRASVWFWTFLFVAECFCL